MQLTSDELWFQKEIDDSIFPDARLKKRFRNLVMQFAQGFGEPIPMAYEPYRLKRTCFANPKETVSTARKARVSSF